MERVTYLETKAKELHLRKEVKELGDVLEDYKEVVSKDRILNILFKIFSSDSNEQKKGNEELAELEIELKKVGFRQKIKLVDGFESRTHPLIKAIESIISSTVTEGQASSIPDSGHSKVAGGDAKIYSFPQKDN